jgi:hypothetical protein
MNEVVGWVGGWWPATRLFGWLHSFIMSSNKCVDNNLIRVFNVITLTNPTKEPQMIKVTFAVDSKILKKSFVNVELHRSMEEANLRALALGWRIVKTEAA